MIKFENIIKTYPASRNSDKKIVLNDVSFRLKNNETLALMGPSGSGKTTIARLLLGLEKPDKGSIVYEGVNLCSLNKKKFKPYRKYIQFIAQDPSSFFDPSIKLGKSIVEPLKNFDILVESKSDRIKQLLDDLKLDEKILDRYPHQISGGEIQRLSILRVLLLEPEILVLDEVTSMLDISVQAQVLHILKQVKKDYQMSYLFISHDREVVDIFADRVIELDVGQVKEGDMEDEL